MPRRLAEEATEAASREIKKREAQRAQQEARTFEQAQEIAETLDKTMLTLRVQGGPTGALYGSVTPTDIADEIWRTRKIRVDRRKIGLDEPIKRIGRFEVPIDVFTDVRVDVKTLVVPEGGELPPEEELVVEEVVVEEPEAEVVEELAEAEESPAAEAEGDEVAEDEHDGD